MNRPLRAGLSARASTEDQKSWPQPMRALKRYAAERGWTVTHQLEEIGV
jgi:hypothetical protein